MNLRRSLGQLRDPGAQPPGLHLVGLILACALVAMVGHHLRRHQIRDLFRDRPPTVKLSPAKVGRSSGPAVPLRVILLDGLSERAAATMPNLQALCATGQAWRVDVGFPTVSLPVQHVLWTGQWQHHSGVLYRQTKLTQPPSAGLPRQMAPTVAVVESHSEIAASFGFQRIWAGDAGDDGGQLFEEAAAQALAGRDALAFVHVLAIDEAGHQHGADSSAYRQAVARADAMLGQWLTRVEPLRWLVLSDHGHRQRGGHGDAEREIRLVQACAWGAWPEPSLDVQHIGLADLSRLLFEAAGVALPAHHDGRRLAELRGATDNVAPLLRVNPWGTALAVAALAAWSMWLYRRGWLVPAMLGLAVAIMGAVVVHGIISWSNPVVFPPWGLGWLKSAAGAMLWLAAWAWRRPHAAVFGGLGTFVVVALALRLALQGVTACLSPTWEVIPFVSAWQSAALWHVAALGAWLAAVVVFLAIAQAWASKGAAK